jgi:azurin
MTTVDQVLERLADDPVFRAQVLQDVAAALAPFGLSADDQERVLQHAEMLAGGEEEEVAVDASAEQT